MRPAIITRRLALVAACMLGAMPADASAQRRDGLAALAPGARVRVHVLERSEPFVTGRLLSHDSAYVSIARSALWTERTRIIPLDSVRRIDVRVQPGRKRYGTVAGATIATVVVGAIALTSLGGSNDVGTLFDLVRLGYYAPVAIGSGALIGYALAPGDVWERVR